MDDPLGDIQRRTAGAAAAFEVPERMIALGAAALGRAPAGPRLQLEVRALRETTLMVAEAHRRDCAQTICPTCEAIRHSLAVSLATIRSEMDGAFGERRTEW